MTNNLMKLRLPQATLQQFTVFELSPEAAQAWVDGLPLANTERTAQHLHQVLNDLNRFALDPALRFHVLEILRPNLLVVLSNLSKLFLNRSLVMQESARQMSDLAGALFDLAATGYALVAVQTIRDQHAIRDFNPARLVSEAVHRGISFCGRNILQSLQLNQPAQANLWLTLHQLYALASRQGLTQLPVEDSLTGSRSIENAYLQALMIACCKPNQLRQNDLAGIYRAMQQWCEHVDLDDHHGDGMFLVDLGSDAPPMYGDMFKGELDHNHRFVDTSKLLLHLEAVRDECSRAGHPGVGFDARAFVPCSLIDHLLLSLGTLSMRHFSRVPSRGELWLGVGLSGTHFHVAGERTFSQLLYGDDARDGQDSYYHNPFLASETSDSEAAADRHDGVEDAAGEAHYIEPEASGNVTWLPREQERAEKTQRYRLHRAHMIDASPAGYGLQWPSDLIPDLKAGHLVCLREFPQDGWAIAAVRWVNHTGNGLTQAGVELLSPGAQPYGALIQQPTGTEGEPLRVLLLPEIQLVGQPHTLITPRARFRERQKVTLLRDGEQFLVQLTRLTAVTASFARFEFRYIKQLEEVLAEDQSAPSPIYDSVWNNI